MVCHSCHGPYEKGQNIATGIVLAKNGYRVKLLKAVKHEKTPDAELDGKEWEFKMIRKAKSNISNAVQNHFNRAAFNGGQSSNIVLHIHQNFELPSLLSGLERAIKADKPRYFQQIIVVYENKVEFIYRREIYFGKAKRKLQRLYKN